MLQLLAPLASILGIEVQDLTARLKRDAIAWGAVAVFLLIAVAFLLGAANAGLSLWVGPVYAPLIMGGIALLIAGTIFGIMSFRRSVEARRKAERRHSAETTALVTTAALTALPMLLKTPLMKQVGIPIGGALAAAFVLAKSSPRSKSSAKRQLPPES
jgi:uncharacterized integral membrane protein